MPMTYFKGKSFSSQKTHFFNFWTQKPFTQTTAQNKKAFLK
jgi:hypothetical protein